MRAILTSPWFVLLVAGTEILGGIALLILAISVRWVNWLSRKGFRVYWIVQLFVLFFAIWGMFKGITTFVDLLEQAPVRH